MAFGTFWFMKEATGLLLSKTYADSKHVDYTYTAAGKLYTRTWSRTVGNEPIVTTYGYDSHTGELTSVTYSGVGTATQLVFGGGTGTQLVLSKHPIRSVWIGRPNGEEAKGYPQIAPITQKDRMKGVQ